MRGYILCLIFLCFLAFSVNTVYAWDTDGDMVDDSWDKCPSIPGYPSTFGCKLFRIMILAHNYEDHNDFWARANAAKDTLLTKTPFADCPLSLDVVILDPDYYQCTADIASPTLAEQCIDTLVSVYGYDWSILVLLDDTPECNAYSSRDYPVVVIHNGLPPVLENTVIPHEIGHQMNLCDEYSYSVYSQEYERRPSGCLNVYPGTDQTGLGPGTYSGGTCQVYDLHTCDYLACCGRDLDGDAATKDVCIMGGGGGLYREDVHPPGEGDCTGSYSNPVRFDDDCYAAFRAELNARGVYCQEVEVRPLVVPATKQWLLTEWLFSLPSPTHATPPPTLVKQQVIERDPRIYDVMQFEDPLGAFRVEVKNINGKDLYTQNFSLTFLEYDVFGATPVDSSLVRLQVPLFDVPTTLTFSFQGIPIYSHDVPCTDIDNDDIWCNNDNCPGIYNPDQTDTDGDEIGDACELQGYSFGGFYDPIDLNAVNIANAGRTIPVKWHLSDANGDVGDPASFIGLLSYSVSCPESSIELTDVVEEYSAGSSGLQYLGDGYWQYNWKTSKSYAGKCKMIYVEFKDGQTSPHVLFKFK